VILGPKRTPADGLAIASAPDVLAALALYNGLTLDLQRGNTEGTLLASAARTADTASADQTNHNARGALIFFNVTVAGGGSGFRLVIQAKDPLSGSYKSLNQYPSAAITTVTGLYVLLLYPGVATTGLLDVISNQALPRTWRVLADHTDATSHTYSASYALIT
jgi:hypothetical protein